MPDASQTRGRGVGDVGWASVVGLARCLLRSQPVISQHTAATEQRRRAAARPHPWLLVCVVLAGCQRAATTPKGSASSAGNATSTSGGASTTFEDPDACVSSQDCETEGNCVAPYDPMPPDAPLDRGPSSCTQACINDNELRKWCIDNASCCGVLRCNPVDGFCEPAGSPLGDDTGSATGTDSSGTGTGDTDSRGSSTGGTSTGGSTTGRDTNDTSSSTGSTDSGTSTGSDASSGSDTATG